MQPPDTANNALESAGLKAHGPKPTIGRIVHYRGPGTVNERALRPEELQVAFDYGDGDLKPEPLDMP